jgi:hypothetical protein
MPTVELWGASLKPGARPMPGEFEKALATVNIACMASGVVGGVSKYYFFGQSTSGGETDADLAIAELSLLATSSRLSSIVKASSAAMGVAFFAELKRGILSSGLVVEQ